MLTYCENLIMAKKRKKYPKDLKNLTTIRLSDDIREKAGELAEKSGISFSDFVRQSIVRNIQIAEEIELAIRKKGLELVITNSELVIKERSGV